MIKSTEGDFVVLGEASGELVDAQFLGYIENVCKVSVELVAMGIIAPLALGLPIFIMSISYSVTVFYA